MTVKNKKSNLILKRVTYVFPCPNCRRHIAIHGINSDSGDVWLSGGDIIKNSTVVCQCKTQIKIKTFPEVPSNGKIRVKEIKRAKRTSGK